MVRFAPASVRPGHLRLRAGLLLAVAAVAAAAAVGAEAIGAFAPLEQGSINARFALRGAKPAPPGIVIVALDARSLKLLGMRPPLPRALHARMIELLHRDGARVIAYDFQFIGASDRRDDTALARALAHARPVLLATHDTPEGIVPVPGGAGDPAALGVVPASVGVLNDSDGVVRRMMYAPVALPTLAVRAAELALGRRVSQREFPHNSAWIDYLGPPGTFRTYSFADVLSGRVPASAFASKIVLVGATDPLEKDVFQTPVSPDPMSGVEVWANSLQTILAGFPLRPAGTLANIALILALAIVPALAAVRLAAWAVVAITVLCAAAFLLSAQLAFDGGRILSVTYPLAGLTLATAGAVTVEVGLEARARRTLRALFARFVPAPVVEELVKQAGKDQRLPGRRAQATVLFCDLRGFTTFAEALEPERVLDVAHEYMSTMSPAVLDHGGTLVNFMGDGLLALFGAPIAQTDHADRALAAAREILSQRLPAFNRWLAEHELPGPFRIGIGLHSGPVMAGSVGGGRRMDYTVIGDTVNTAARIQEMTKQQRCQLLISHSTLQALTHPTPDLTAAGEHTLRGRSAAVLLYTLGT